MHWVTGMFRMYDNVWVSGYIMQYGEKIDVFTSGVVLETQTTRRNTVLVRLDKFNGDTNVNKRVLVKFVRLLDR